MDTPFIKLYKLCTGYYFYDIGKNCILSVNSTVYARLQELCKYGYEEFEKRYYGTHDAGYVTIKKLMKNNYLSNKKPTVIYHPYTEYVEEYLNKRLNHIILQVTQNCNFMCDYCPYAGNGMLDRTHAIKFMPFDIAKKAVDLLIDNSTYSDKLSIGFYGGEPLLNFKLIEKVVYYVEERVKNKKILYGITTNAYLINRDIINFFKKYNFAVTVSLDGPKEIHDKNRRLAIDGSGTYDRVYANMSLMKENDLRFGINAVWDTEVSFRAIDDYFSSDPLYDKIPYNIEQVLTGRIDIGYNIDPGSEYQQDVYSVKSYLSYLGVYGKLTEDKRQYVITPFEAISKQIVERDKVLDVFHHGGPCIPGYLKLFIDCDGNFYPCEKISGKSQAMKIGTIENGFDMEQIRNILNIGKITQEECKSCWAMNLCQICAMWADNDEQCFCKKMKVNRCNYIRNNANKGIMDYIIMSEIKQMIMCNTEADYEQKKIMDVSV